jgi:acyl-CoA thioesterase FadM
MTRLLLGLRVQRHMDPFVHHAFSRKVSAHQQIIILNSVILQCGNDHHTMAIRIHRINDENEVSNAEKMVVHVDASWRVGLRLSGHWLSHWLDQQ